LGQRETNGPVPAVGDANSIQWALGKKVGDVLDYADEHGRTFQIRLVGGLANSVLQGNLLIDESAFRERFPSRRGYNYFLISAPSNAVSRVTQALAGALEDQGLELVSAAERLNAFNAVQNTYLGAFQLLGALGLLLGSAGLAIVLLRNLLERRGELAVLTAVGFSRPRLLQLVLSEHAVLLAAGLGLGVLCAAVAVFPAWILSGTQPPAISLALTMTAVMLNGLAWTVVAARLALRGRLLEALRNE
jgi:ABC-type antimicrobial peptide transport system permease subunit